MSITYIVVTSNILYSQKCPWGKVLKKKMKTENKKKLGVARPPSFGRVGDEEPAPQSMGWFGYPKMAKWEWLDVMLESNSLTSC